MMPFAMLETWLTLGKMQQDLTIAASQVMMERTAMMARGAMSPAEATRMILEKPAAFAQGYELAATAMAGGALPAVAMAAALKPLSGRAAANARRLRRGR